MPEITLHRTTTPSSAQQNRYSSPKSMHPSRTNEPAPFRAEAVTPTPEARGYPLRFQRIRVGAFVLSNGQKISQDHRSPYKQSAKAPPSARTLFKSPKTRTFLPKQTCSNPTTSPGYVCHEPSANYDEQICTVNQTQPKSLRRSCRNGGLREAFFKTQALGRSTSRPVVSRNDKADATETREN
jgi:hypothetical protein